jgi:hypothetical protein
VLPLIPHAIALLGGEAVSHSEELAEAEGINGEDLKAAAR